MKKAMMFALVVLLSGCKPAPPTETVESLVANPERIKEIRRLCRQDRAKVTDELCLRTAEAAKRRFHGDRPDQSTK